MNGMVCLTSCMVHFNLPILLKMSGCIVAARLTLLYCYLCFFLFVLPHKPQIQCNQAITSEFLHDIQECIANTNSRIRDTEN